MATVHANATKLAQLFNPQVVGDLVRTKLVDNIKFSPLCRVDSTLSGQPGNTLTLPTFAYIGDAENVAEGGDIPIKQLTSSTAQVTIAKAGIGVQLTDEAILSGFGDPVGEAVSQITLSIATKVDNDILTILEGIDSEMTHAATTAGNFTADDIADALVKFGEDIDGEKVILISPEQYNYFRKAKEWIPASEIAADVIIRGSMGMVQGCQVMITNKLKGKKAAYIVKPGALALYMKRDVLVETDRDIINKSNIITADEHYAGYLYDASKAIKVTHQ